MPLNIPLLIAVRDHILAEPATFDMVNYFTDDDEDADKISAWHVIQQLGVRSDPWCGTSACIAGWAVKLEPDRQRVQLLAVDAEFSIDRFVAELFGLPADIDPSDLFNVGYWPNRLVGSEAECAVQLLNEIIEGKNPWAHDEGEEE